MGDLCGLIAGNLVGGDCGEGCMCGLVAGDLVGDDCGEGV